MKTRDQLIFDAREICDLWFKPWDASKGARLEGHGITVLNPERVIERLGEILSEAEELRAVSAAGPAGFYAGYLTTVTRCLPRRSDQSSAGSCVS